MKDVLFDVCNDYSLDGTESQEEPDPKVYRKVKSHGGTLYIHRKYEELHYYRGDANMQGLVLQYSD